ncbi:MAG: hypothetical protein HY319_14010 [Armatimonadetes bacterium]|nr:hypothetical protein [Armatimonadota bacterium]
MRFCRGISLLESLLAGLILCVVMFVIVSLYPTSLFGMKKGHELIAASNLAQRILDEKRGQSFDTIDSEAGDAACDGTLYHYDLKVSDGDAGHDVKKLKLEISWDPSTGTDRRTTTFETRLFHFRHP